MTTMPVRTVRTWVDMLQFDVARQVLEAEGIPSDVHGWNIDRLDDTSSAFVAHRSSLRVRENPFERAGALPDQTVGRSVGSANGETPRWPLSSEPCSTRRRP